MAIDFTVIFSVRQRFGDRSHDWEEAVIPQEAPWVGLSENYAFTCPNVDRAQKAVLQFQSFGVSLPNNSLEINGSPIYGGISVGPQAISAAPRRPLWQTHSLIVGEYVLEEGNVLRVEAAATGGGNFDSFILDNVVIFFKTRATLLATGA